MQSAKVRDTFGSMSLQYARPAAIPRPDSRLRGAVGRSDRSAEVRTPALALTTKTSPYSVENADKDGFAIVARRDHYLTGARRERWIGDSPVHRFR